MSNYFNLFCVFVLILTILISSFATKDIKEKIKDYLMDHSILIGMLLGFNLIGIYAIIDTLLRFFK